MDRCVPKRPRWQSCWGLRARMGSDARRAVATRYGPARLIDHVDRWDRADLVAKRCEVPKSV